MFIRIKRQLLSNKKNNMIILFFFFVLTCFISVGYSALEQNLMISGDANYYANSNKLYDVLKRAARIGTYAKEYTGSHQDSFAGSGTEKIYYWNATSSANGTAILDKNNVIFAGHCWQMIRTTDTGGVKMVYNGEVENNQCMSTRTNHVGYKSKTLLTLSGGDYYYGTNFEYNSSSNAFSLTGDLQHAVWNDTTSSNLIGKYTCRQTTASATCSTLYLVESYYSASSANTITLDVNSHYSQFGLIAFNPSDSYNILSPSYVGYMYNTVHEIAFKSNSFEVSNKTWAINTSYYYSDTIDYGTLNAGKYTLVNPELISSLTDYNDLVGKYVLDTSGTNSTTARYITKVWVDTNKVRYRSLSDGDLNTSLTVGDSFNKSGNTYILVNPVNITYIDWNNNISDFDSYKGKFICDGNNTSCTILKQIHFADALVYYYFDSTTEWSYAENVSYNNGTYTLTGDIKTFWDVNTEANKSLLPTHHYTCQGNGTSCTEVTYVYYFSNSANTVAICYITLTGEENIEAVINAMFHASNVNTKNSIIKTGLESWYSNYLYPYDSYIEDTVFCNNRNIRSLGGWNANGGALNSLLLFEDSSYNTDLSCDRLTDKFSTLNSSALLKYKVGLMTAPEAKLLQSSTLLKTQKLYWLLSPYEFSSGDAKIYVVNTTGTVDLKPDLVTTGGLRPVISLIPGIEFVAGDGSMANPYIVDAESSVSNPDVPSISGGATKVYGASSTTLTCTSSSNYGNGTNLYYSFGYANSDGGTPENWIAPTTTNTLTISATEYVGQRWYSCRVYASDGNFSTNIVASSTESDAEVTINNAAITFDATTNGGTLSGDSTLYVRSGNANVYTELRGSTTGSIPTASKSGFIFNGWYTANTGGSKVLNDNGSFTGTEVSGYTNASSWAATTNQTLYAQFSSAVNAPNTPTISGGTTKIFNYQATTLTCATTSTYPSGTSIYYEFGYSTTSGGTVTWLGSPSTTATLSVAKDAYRGTRYYTCRVYASDGTSSSSTVEATTTTTMSIVNARLYFNANNGTVSGTNPVYVAYGSTDLYTTRTGTTTASIPNVSRSGYTFSGWYTAKSGGTQVITSAKVVKASVSSWTNSSKQWLRTATGDTNTANVLYAHWSRSISWTYYYDWGDAASCSTAAYCHDPCEYHNYSYWGCSSSSSTPPSSASQTSGRYCWCGS